MKKKEACYSSKCSCPGCPIFAVLIFLVALVWILAEFGFLALNLPWLAIIVFLMSLKMLLKCYQK